MHCNIESRENERPMSMFDKFLVWRLAVYRGKDGGLAEEGSLAFLVVVGTNRERACSSSRGI